MLPILRAMGLPITLHRARRPHRRTETKTPAPRALKRNGNPHAKDFEGDSVELDALPARVLRDLVNENIKSHIDIRQFNALRAAEDFLSARFS